VNALVAAPGGWELILIAAQWLVLALIVFGIVKLATRKRGVENDRR